MEIKEKIIKLIDTCDKYYFNDDKMRKDLLSVVKVYDEINGILDEDYYRMVRTIKFRPFSGSFIIKFNKFNKSKVKDIVITKEYLTKSFTIRFRRKAIEDISLYYEDGELGVILGSGEISNNNIEVSLPVIDNYYGKALDYIIAGIEYKPYIKNRPFYYGKTNLRDIKSIDMIYDKLFELHDKIEDIKETNIYYVPEYREFKNILIKLKPVYDLFIPREASFEIDDVLVEYTQKGYEYYIYIKELHTEKVLMRFMFNKADNDSHKIFNVMEERIKLCNSILDKILIIVNNLEEIKKLSYPVAPMRMIDDFIGEKIWKQSLPYINGSDDYNKEIDYILDNILGYDVPVSVFNREVNNKKVNDIFIHHAKLIVSEFAIPFSTMRFSVNDYEVELRYAKQLNPETYMEKIYDIETLQDTTENIMERFVLKKNDEVLVYKSGRIEFIREGFIIKDIDPIIYSSIKDIERYLLDTSNEISYYSSFKIKKEEI